MLILNDIHLSVQRKAGTTPGSQEALRTYLFTSFSKILSETTETHLLILGDLFDSFEISARDWIDAYLILSKWVDSGNTLTLVAGNHDWSPRGGKVSSFEMLARVLKEQSDKVTMIGIDQWDVCPEFAVLAHCSNQDIFNLKLSEILALTDCPPFVLLHTNYDNNFAAQSDHSLNVSTEQARAFADRGITLVFAHEHQERRAMKGKVVVLGNQWASSVADCLNNTAKFAHVLKGGEITSIETWAELLSYAEVDWRELDQVDQNLQFVRVAGSATGNEAGEVISTIAKFRQRSTAFVVSNAVKIDGIVQAEELPESFEAAKKFDVLTFIKGNLDEPEYDVVQTQLLEVQQ